MRVTESPVRDLLRLFVWYPLRLLVERLPSRCALAVLWAMGDVHSLASRGRKARLAAGVRAVAPGLSPDATARQVKEAFRTHYANQLSIFIFPGLTSENLDQLLEISGREHLHAALAAGAGAVLPIGHFGPSQLPLVGLGLLGYPMLQIGFQNDEGLTYIGKHVSFRLRQIYEAKMPARIVPPGAGTRRIIAHLKTGGLVMTTADDGPGQPPFGRHAVFDFPGGRRSFPLGPARLALATGAALVPVFLTPGQRAPYRAVIDAPIPPPADTDKDAAALAMTREFLDRYAQVVTRCPGWWHCLEEVGGDASGGQGPALDPARG